MSIKLKHKDTGVVKNAPTGFSWTSLFFGFFPPLLRGDVKWFILAMIIAVFTFGISWLILPFIYNKIYIKNLMEIGYIPADDESKEFLIKKRIMVAEQKDVRRITSLEEVEREISEKINKEKSLLENGVIDQETFLKRKEELLKSLENAKESVSKDKSYNDFIEEKIKEGYYYNETDDTFKLREYPNFFKAEKHENSYKLVMI